MHKNVSNALDATQSAVGATSNRLCKHNHVQNVNWNSIQAGLILNQAECDTHNFLCISLNTGVRLWHNTVYTYTQQNVDPS